MARLKFCPHCGCAVPAGKPCPCRGGRKRKPTAGDATRAEREPWRSHYKTAEYQRNRQAAISAQAGRCKDCGMICATFDGRRWTTSGMGGEVDHEVPLCEGGTDEPSNLVLRCKSCHSRAETKRRMARKRRL